MFAQFCQIVIINNESVWATAKLMVEQKPLNSAHQKGIYILREISLAIYFGESQFR